MTSGSARAKRGLETPQEGAPPWVPTPPLAIGEPLPACVVNAPLSAAPCIQSSQLIDLAATQITTAELSSHAHHDSLSSFPSSSSHHEDHHPPRHLLCIMMHSSRIFIRSPIHHLKLLPYSCLQLRISHGHSPAAVTAWDRETERPARSSFPPHQTTPWR